MRNDCLVSGVPYIKLKSKINSKQKLKLLIFWRRNFEICQNKSNFTKYRHLVLVS